MSAFHRDRVLIVEDEYIIATELARALTNEGAIIAGPAPTLARAMELAQSEHIDGAILDVNLRGEMVYPLIDLLQARGVPIVLTTGYEGSALPDRHKRLPRCEKPFSETDVVVTLIRAMQKEAPGEVQH